MRRLTQNRISRVFQTKPSESKVILRVLQTLISKYQINLGHLDDASLEGWMKDCIQQYKADSKVHTVSRNGLILKEVAKAMREIKKSKHNILEFWCDLEETEEIRYSNYGRKEEPLYNVKFFYIIGV